MFYTKCLLLFLSSVFFLNNHPTQHEQMQFTLTTVSSERSLDSHTSTGTFRLKDKLLTYKRKHRGARPIPPLEIQAELTVAQIVKLTALIQKLELDKTYNKDYKAEAMHKLRIRKHYKTTFQFKEVLIEVSGGEEQKEDPKVKNLKKFEKLLNRLLGKDAEQFEKDYELIMKQ